MQTVRTIELEATPPIDPETRKALEDVVFSTVPGNIAVNIIEGAPSPQPVCTVHTDLDYATQKIIEGKARSVLRGNVVSDSGDLMRQLGTAALVAGGLWLFFRIISDGDPS